MIYLDNAATTFPKPPCVAEEMRKCLKKYCGNPGRSSHKLSVASSEKIYEARALLDLEAKPGGDRLLGNGASIPVELAGTQYTKNQKNLLINLYLINLNMNLMLKIIFIKEITAKKKWSS